MRIRTIKPEFFTHEGLYAAEQETNLPVRLAFIGLWCAADRDGRFKWEPRRIGVAVLPYDTCEFSRVLDALTTRGFIVKYRVEGVDYGAIPSFGKHQIVNNRERGSEYPEPPKIEASDASSTREPRVEHASKAEGKGKEGKGKDSPPASEDGLKFSDWFRTLLPEKVNLVTHWRENWARCYDDLLRIDHRDKAGITEVCSWARKDSFWQSHFQAPSKLRERDKNGVQFFDVFAARIGEHSTNGRRRPRQEDLI